MEVFVVPWTETERGWGSRPDGYTVHFVKNNILRECAEITEESNKCTNGVPDEYSYPEIGQARFATIIHKHAPEHVLANVLKAKYFRVHERNPTWLK